jgi:transglutaminase-like putative cysteine protease
VSGDATRAVYRVRQHYRYVYTGLICDIKQKLVMVPPDRHADQLLLSYDLDVRGTSGRLQVDWDTDRFGNRICRVQAETVEHALDFEAWFEVCRGAPARPLTLDAEECSAYLGVTGLTAPNDQIAAAARYIQAQSDQPRTQAEQALEWTASAIAYHLGVTGTQTPAAMALHLGQGVCQDYAHIMLALLRTLHLPARYVSGHLLGEGAPHAWVEVLVPESADTPAEWIAYDPTHRRQTTPNYITVAVGRDFADVTATSGVFSGAATGKLHWSKQAERIEPSPATDVAEEAA